METVRKRTPPLVKRDTSRRSKEKRPASHTNPLPVFKNKLSYNLPRPTRFLKRFIYTHKAVGIINRDNTEVIARSANTISPDRNILTDDILPRFSPERDRSTRFSYSRDHISLKRDQFIIAHT